MNFDEHFRLVSESCKRVEDDRAKLIESIIELSNVQKENQSKQRELNEIEIEITKVAASNKDLKLALMEAVIERDELNIKKSHLSDNIERLSNQINNMERESDELLRSDPVDHVCNRYSIGAQISILNKIQEAKNKLASGEKPFAYYLRDSATNFN